MLAALLCNLLHNKRYKAGGKKGYIVNGERYYLNNYELAMLLARLEKFEKAPEIKYEKSKQTIRKKTLESINRIIESLDVRPEPGKRKDDDELVLMLAIDS